jgi:ParB/RepB/Spo0J family partition protein
MTQKSEPELIPANRNAIRSQEGILQESNTYKVEYDLIIAEEDFNIRNEYTGIEELAESIRENGILVPLLGLFVKKGNKTYFHVTEGHRRVRALALNKSLGYEVGEVPCRSHPMSLEQRIFSMIITQDNVKLKDVELANSFRRLVNLGVKPTDIARKITKSITFVNDMLLLSDQTSSVKQAVASKQASATAVIATAKVIGPDATKKKVEESISKNEKFTVDKAKVVKAEIETSKPKLDFSKPSEIEIPKTLEGMRIVRDELLALKERSHKQVKFLNDLIAKIKLREEMEATPVSNKTTSDAYIGISGNGWNIDESALFRQVKPETEISYEGKFDTILWTKFCSQYCEKLGMDTCKEIFNLFKEELS